MEKKIQMSESRENAIKIYMIQYPMMQFLLEIAEQAKRHSCPELNELIIWSSHRVI